MPRNMYDAKLPLVFPSTFLWGTATAAHQVEGSPGSNWGVWERSEARIRELKERNLDPEEYIAGNACEFEMRYPTDFSLAKYFGHNAIRFSVNWATVEPATGRFDMKVLTRYRRMVHAARRCGLEPVITLYHWTHPQWFEQEGGWKQNSAPMQFARFVAKVLQYIGARVTWYTTLNEPNVYASYSFRLGIWPPCECNETSYRKIIDNLAEAHRLAYALIKRKNPTARVGIAHSVGWTETIEPKIRAEADEWNYQFIKATKSMQDFIGLNLYFHNSNEWEPADSPFKALSEEDPCTNTPVISDFGWGMCPRAIYGILKEFSATYPRLPLIVTEHGHAVAELKDKRRCWYLFESLKWAHRAIHEGVDLRGYLHWSLLDNFEWAEGYAKKFGLIQVDRATQKRTPRVSAYLLRDIIKTGALTQEIADQYKDVIRHPHAA